MKGRLRRALRYILGGVPTQDVRAEISYINGVKRLEGKRIIVTGGGRGLGRAMAEKFIAEGADVLIAGRNAETLRTAAEEIGAKWLQLDMREADAFGRFLDDAQERLGGIDCLVNNAGISLHEGNFLNVSPHQLDDQFSTNLRGPYFLTQKLIERKIAAGEPAAILFVSSERGEYVDDLPYGLTKTAVNSLVRGLAYRFVDKGIRVNAVAPGVTASEMTGFSPDGNLSCDYNRTGRVYLPGEVAEIAAFLLCDASRCLNGQILVCNEGKSINAHWK